MIITNGILILPDGPQKADLLCRQGRIVEILEPGYQPSADESVFDAGGLWVLPGAIDAHTHFGMPLGGGLSSLGWRESSEAALLGGTTTIVDFANPNTDEPLPAAVNRWQEMADGHILCDYGLHCTVVNTSDERLAEIPALMDLGIPTFKGFLAYKGRLMLAPPAMKKLMRAVKSGGGLLLVHAEDGEMNAVAQDVLLNAGRIGPRYHPMAHPAKSEIQAVDQVLQMAVETNCPLEVVHMSLARSAELVLEAKAAHPDLPLWGEVCLQHLFTNDGLYESGHEAALAAICSPPLRSEEDGRTLQEYLIRGDIDFLSTDHCEFPLQTKSAAAAGGFHKVPNGCGGVGERLVFSYARLVADGKWKVEDWIDAVAGKPGQAMGLTGRKGKLEPGYDADLVLFDPTTQYQWSPLGQSDLAGNLWAGQKVTGAVRHVWLRGKQVVENGRLVMDQPGGLFLKRTLS